MPRMPYFAGLSTFSSTLSLTTLAFSRYFSATASTVGASIRQGPHQAAQKSTSTGLSEPRTSVPQFVSVTSAINSLITFSFGLCFRHHWQFHPLLAPASKHYSKHMRLLAYGD